MRRVPGWLRNGYTVVVAVLVPAYTIEYGVVNFLWFSNIALLGALAAIWIGSRLLVSMMAVAVLLPEMAWNGLFWSRLLVGWEGLGLVDYMFDPAIPLGVRLLSLYHVPLPFLLLWLVWAWGYDPRALRWQTALAWVVLVVTFLVTSPPTNVNLVHGPLDPQGAPVLPSPIPLLLLMVGLPLAVYLPTHAILGRFAPEPERSPRRTERAR